MNLKEFISLTLTQIIEGVEDAKSRKGVTRVNPKPRKDTKIEKLHEAGYTISDTTELIQHVEFDVALTITEGKETKGGIGVFVAGIGLGSQGQSDKGVSSVSRIKFKVPLSLP